MATTRPALEPFGWDARREAAFDAHAAPGQVPGRVTGAARDAIRARTEDGDTHVIVQRGFRRDAATASEFPVVGDWLALEPVGDGQTALRAVLPRTSRFARGDHDAQRVQGGIHAEEQVIAANIDTVVIVAALDHDLNLRRLERYLALAWSSGADPVVLLNKSDLCDDVPGRLGEVRSIASGAPVLVASALRAEGLDALEAWTGPARTVVLLGMSGVGKSTITNLLLGEQRQAVREVREGDARGRHTTTSRELFQLPNGALLIDTPGMRSIGLWDADDGLDRAFTDIEALAAACRFADCSHEVEPGCAVAAAIEAGELDADRLRARRKLHRELGLVAQRSDAASRHAAGRRWGKVTREAAKAAEAKRHGWSL
ncbi:MAG: ribosome small subunit-dependent GTPase A [Chloroflexota bacterium]